MLMHKISLDWVFFPLSTPQLWLIVVPLLVHLCDCVTLGHCMLILAL